MALSRNGDLAHLPQEIFQMIIQHLQPVDLVRCRRVSSAWHRAFTNASNLALVLKLKFPQAREVRELVGRNKSPSAAETFENDTVVLWQTAFDTVVQRYHRLAHGIPRIIQRFNIQPVGSDEAGYDFFSVPHWISHASLPGSIDIVFKHAFWTYEEGLVVYPNAQERTFMLLDVDTEEQFMVPFVLTDKVIRRLRLCDKLLVIEWAENEPYHWLNDHDSVHRHFATSFEVNKAGRGWDITLRNEWKIMFLGHPLGEIDRFFSCHSRTHYAIYGWQPNRSLYTADEDAPIESLSIWDISVASEYRPSQDPAGKSRDSGPSQIASFAFRDLDFYSVRQGGRPAIMKLEIDSESNSISITEVKDLSSFEFNVLEYKTQSRITTFPFLGQGPSWQRDIPVHYPPYRGNGSMDATPWTVTSPWPCWGALCESRDEEANVAFCITYKSPETEDGYPRDDDTSMVTIHTPHGIRCLDRDLAKELSFKSKICGDERFIIGENDRNQLVIMKF